MNLQPRIYIAAAAACLLALLIVSSVFIHRLGVLKEREKAWREEAERSKAKIEVLRTDIEAKQLLNEQLAAQVAELEAEADTLWTTIEEREVKILEIKKYGQKTIDHYLSLPDDERELQFAKLIGR